MYPDETPDRYRATAVDWEHVTDGGEDERRVRLSRAVDRLGCEYLADVVSDRVVASLEGSYPDVVRVIEEGGGETRIESGNTWS